MVLWVPLIILFTKGCPNPIYTFCAAAAPTQAAAALARRQPPLRSAPCPQAMPLWAPPLYRLAAGRRCPYGLTAGKQPLAGWLVAASGASARRLPSCWRRARSRPPAYGLLPLRVAAPCRGASAAASLAVSGRHYMGAGCGWPALHGGLVVAGRPSSSLPSLRKRI
ncbi:hypothetical protein GW17_00052713 [Ensete ventricosum]|nr:hypothetical protein GW17_00052713 [Ensete ventricosum]